MSDSKRQTILRQIPSVSTLVDSPGGKTLCATFGDGITKFVVRQELDQLRQNILSGACQTIPSPEKLAASLEKHLSRLTRPEGRKAINATGILLHTALGRAPYAGNATDALSIFSGYSVLQASLDDGKRCKRDARVEEMLKELTGCEAATVINNNAEATMLVLNTLAQNKEAIISRGQLVEIGGSFRMPDVMEQSRAVMREIGTTNRTHIKDYRAAVTPDTGVFVHVHTSNYRVRGFSGTPGIKELCEFRDAEFADIPVIDDIGSGALVSLSQFGLSNEPLIKDSIQAGTDVVCFSGDKLISGPQCGILCGKKQYIDRIRKNPFARMFRVDKVTLAVLESTLLHFINGTYKQEIPFYRMLSASISDLTTKAERIRESLAAVSGVRCQVADGAACVGSGSIPDEEIPDKVLHIEFKDPTIRLEKIAQSLRQNIPSIFARISGNNLVFSMRSLLPGDDDHLIRDLPAVFSSLK